MPHHKVGHFLLHFTPQVSFVEIVGFFRVRHATFLTPTSIVVEDCGVQWGKMEQASPQGVTVALLKEVVDESRHRALLRYAHATARRQGSAFSARKVSSTPRAGDCSHQ